MSGGVYVVILLTKVYFAIYARTDREGAGPHISRRPITGMGYILLVMYVPPRRVIPVSNRI